MDNINLQFKSSELIFNGILVNDYRDGNDNIGAHSDNEKGLNQGLILAISLGSSRKFRIRYKNGNKFGNENYMDVQTKHGQLLVIRSRCQRHRVRLNNL